MQDLKPLEDSKCCISQHLQFEAEKNLQVSKGFGILLGETARKKSRLSRKKSQLTESTKNTNNYRSAKMKVTIKDALPSTHPEH